MSALVRSSTFRWVLLALAGLAIAIAVGIVASQLTSQRIGLASEPLSAGESLAPNPDRGSGSGNRGHGDGHTTTAQTTTTTTATTTNETSTTSTTTDDNSGSDPGSEGGEDPSGNDDD
jgi:hypothetical protein